MRALTPWKWYLAKPGLPLQIAPDNEELILVNERDEPTGFLAKDAAHDGEGVLHRAFSVFLFNPVGDLLLQKRSSAKRLWPGYWSNSCCSHPRRGEDTAAAASRRILEELGVQAQLHFMYSFRYQSAFDDVGAENEFCWVFTCVSEREIVPNEQEIEAWEFVSPQSLQRWIAASPERFTPWMKMEWRRLSAEFRQQLPVAVQMKLRGRT